MLNIDVEYSYHNVGADHLTVEWERGGGELGTILKKQHLKPGKIVLATLHIMHRVSTQKTKSSLFISGEKSCTD